MNCDMFNTCKLLSLPSWVNFAFFNATFSDAISWLAALIASDLFCKLISCCFTKLRRRDNSLSRLSNVLSRKGMLSAPSKLRKLLISKTAKLMHNFCELQNYCTISANYYPDSAKNLKIQMQYVLGGQYSSQKLMNPQFHSSFEK